MNTTTSFTSRSWWLCSFFKKVDTHTFASVYFPFTGAAAKPPHPSVPAGLQPQRIRQIRLHVAHPAAGLPGGPAHVGILHPPGGYRHADGGAGQNAQAHALQKRVLCHRDSLPSASASDGIITGNPEKCVAKYCVSRYNESRTTMELVSVEEGNGKQPVSPFLLCAGGRGRRRNSEGVIS